MTRVAIAGLWHETNTYSARATDLADFEALELVRGDELLRLHAGTGTVVGGMLEAEGLDLVPLLSAGAWPSGRVRGEALRTLLALLEDELEGAGPLDGVLLNLHGAMVGEGTDDVEFEVARRVRAIAGERPLVCVLDLHGNPSPDFVSLCDAVVAYATYPHVDMQERGREAAALMAEILRGRKLRALCRKVPLLSTPLAQATEERPMRDLLALARKLSTEAGLVRVSLLPGFPYSDVARAGFSVVATAEEGKERAADEVASALAGEAEARRSEFEIVRPGPVEAVERALASARRPVVLVDLADNVGGGSPGDGTVLLGELLARKAEGAVVQIADAEVARRAAELGPGARLVAEVGGKTDDRHGPPVPIVARILRVREGRYRARGPWMTGREFSMGRTALLDTGNVQLVVSERVVPPFHSEQLQSMGIDPSKASVLVVKGAVAWRAAYGEIAGEVIEVDTPGICPLDPGRLERSTVPMRF